VPRPERPKRILCHGPSTEQFARLVRSFAGVPGCAPAEAGADGSGITWDGLSCTFVYQPDVAELLAELHHSYVNLLVLDLRCEDGCLRRVAERTFAILAALDAADDVEDRYAFHRIVALVGGASTPFLDDVILRLGARGVGRILRQEDFGGGEAADARWAQTFLVEASRIMRAHLPGKRALCAAGGGITGIFFELGALKCLDDSLSGGGVNDFDMFFGISAGAVVSGPLAVGYSVDEFMAAVAGVPGGRIPPLDLRLFRLGHLDLPGFSRRARLALRTAWGGVRSLVRGGRDLSREQLLFDYADLVAPPFRADRFEEVLRGILSAPGGSNDFRRLPRPLYIGATDQDERRHVLFGDEQNDEVPISQAIQASLSINPAFAATPIGGRFYEDGAVTRTSNFVEAIHRGANLIVVLDPFLPYVARTPGFNDRRGVLYNIDQDVRTISYTRFETSRGWVLRKHPEVSSYTFVPGNRQRRLISHNPMDHRPYLEIWRGAYLSTLKRLRYQGHRLAGDLAYHGVKLDLRRAEEVAARLEKASSLGFADFFPEGRAAIRLPPLIGARAPRPPPEIPAASFVA
jgi:predicted acylesterase/phospholipase RssA